MQETKTEPEISPARPDETEYRKAHDVVIPLQPDDIEKIVTAPVHGIPFASNRELTQLTNILNFLTRVQAIVLSTPLRSGAEKVDFAAGLRELKAIFQTSENEPFVIKRYVERYQQAWNQYLRSGMSRVEVSVFENLVSCNRARITGILKSIPRPDVEDQAAVCSFCECLETVTRRRDWIATKFSVLLHGKNLQDVSDLYADMVETWELITKFVNMTGQATPDLMYTLSDCSRAIFDAVLDLKTMIILKQLVPFVDDVCQRVLKGSGEAEVGLHREDGESVIVVEPSTSFLRMFIDFKDTLKPEQDLTETASNVRAFLEKIQDVTGFGLGPVLCSLYFKFRQLELVGIKLKWACECLKPGEAGTELYIGITDAISVFKSVIGREINTSILREMLLPSISIVRERAGSQSLAGHKIVNLVRIDLLVSLLDEIVASLKVIDDTICVAFQVDELILKKLSAYDLRTLNFHERFFKFPSLLSHYDHSVPKVVHDVTEEYYEFVGRMSGILKTKGLSMAVSSERHEMEIPDISGLLAVFREFDEKDLVQSILFGPPLMSEEETFHILSKVYHNNLGKTEPNEQVELAVEALHMLHFIFLSMQGIGLLSYSNAWHLTYMRAHIAFLLKRDILSGSSLLTYDRAQLLMEMQSTWTDCVNELKVLDSISVLGRIRLAMEQVLQYVTETSDVENACQILKWFLLNLWQVPYKQETDYIVEVIDKVQDSGLAAVATLLHEYSDNLKVSHQVVASLKFVSVFLGDSDPLSLVDAELRAQIPVLGYLLTRCAEDGTVSYDQSVQAALASAPISDVSSLLQKLHDTLEVRCDLITTTMATEISKIGSKKVQLWFSLISRGGYCEDNLVHLVEEVLSLSCEAKSQLSGVVTKLVNLLALFRVRDHICSRFDALNFTMLRQFNMRFVSSFANSFLFLTSAMSVTSIISKRVAGNCRMLVQFAEQIPLTRRLDTELMSQINNCCSQMWTSTDFFSFKNQLAIIENAVEATCSSDLIESFRDETKPDIEALKPTSDQLMVLWAMIRKHCEDEDTCAIVGDCISTILMLCRLVSDLESFFNFSNSPSDSYVDLSPQVEASLLSDSGLEVVQPVVPMDSVPSNNHAVAPLGHKDPETGIIDTLRSLQNRYETFAVAQEESATPEYAELSQQVDSVQREVNQLKPVEAKCSTASRTVSAIRGFQDAVLSEFTNLDVATSRAVERQTKDEISLRCDLDRLADEVAAKRFYLTVLRSMNETSGVFTETPAQQDGSGVEELPREDVDANSSVPVEVASHSPRTQTGQTFMMERHLSLRDTERYVPKALEGIFKPHTFLPGEAREQIERLVAKYEQRESPSGHSPQESGPSEEEPSTSYVEISETKKQYMKERLSDQERRIRTAESIIAELLARNKGQNV